MNVTLDSGTHNSYRDFIFDQAEFHHLIGIFEQFSLNEYQMDDRLKEIFGKFHNR